MPCLPSNPERLYVAGKNATLMLSRDGGLNWETVKNSADNQYVGLYANSEGHVMATGYTFHSGWWDDAPAGTQFSLHMMGTHFGAMWNERTGGRTDSSRLTASGMVYDSGADPMSMCGPKATALYNIQRAYRRVSGCGKTGLSARTAGSHFTISKCASIMAGLWAVSRLTLGPLRLSALCSLPFYICRFKTF